MMPRYVARCIAEVNAAHDEHPRLFRSGLIPGTQEAQERVLANPLDMVTHPPPVRGRQGVQRDRTQEIIQTNMHSLRVSSGRENGLDDSPDNRTPEGFLTIRV